MARQLQTPSRSPLSALRGALVLVLFLANAMPALANGPCGPPTVFSGTYSQRCDGPLNVTIHSALDIGGDPGSFDRQFEIPCGGASTISSQVAQFRQAVVNECRALGGDQAGCNRLADDLGRVLSDLGNGIHEALPHKIEVNAWWNQLPWIPFGPNRHRTQITDIYRNGDRRLHEYVLDNTCEKRGDIGALGLAIPGAGGNQHGVCFATLAAVAEGRIEPQDFDFRRDVTLDGSITCLAEGFAANVGVAIELTLVGERH